jgi:hypothetical protein
LKTISTGQPSNLKTYRQIALIMSGMDESSNAVKFFDDKITEQGETMEVIADETQMFYLIINLNKEERNG